MISEERESAQTDKEKNVGIEAQVDKKILKEIV